MKHRIVFAAAIFFSALFFNSCSSEKGISIEKRHYGKGYYVHLNRGQNNSAVSKEIMTSAAEIEKPAFAENNLPAFIPAAKPAPVVEKNIPGVNPKKRAHSKMKRVNNKKRVFKFSAPRIRPVSRPGSSTKHPASGDTETILMVILAIFISPLAVYLKEGASRRFWVDLICWLLGGGLFFSPYRYGGALFIFAVVYALLIVLDVI